MVIGWQLHPKLRGPFLIPKYVSGYICPLTTHLVVLLSDQPCTILFIHLYSVSHHIRPSGCSTVQALNPRLKFPREENLYRHGILSRVFNLVKGFSAESEVIVSTALLSCLTSAFSNSLTREDRFAHGVVADHLTSASQNRALSFNQ